MPTRGDPPNVPEAFAGCLVWLTIIAVLAGVTAAITWLVFNALT